MGTIDGGAREPFGTDGGSAREARARLAEDGGEELREGEGTEVGIVEECFVSPCVSLDFSFSFPGGVDEDERSRGIQKV